MNLTFIRNRLMAAVATSLMLAASGALAEEDHETKEAWRLFVADHTQPVVRAIDLESGKELGRYDLKGHAALTASASGRTVFAAQGESDVIHVIRTGITFSDHGEHRDLEVSDPGLLPVTFEGERPAHVVPHGDEAVLFYDRGGKAEIVSENALLDGRRAVRTIDTTAPHRRTASRRRHLRFPRRERHEPLRRGAARHDGDGDGRRQPSERLCLFRLPLRPG